MGSFPGRSKRSFSTGPTQTFIQWVAMDFLAGIKRFERDALYVHLVVMMNLRLRGATSTLSLSQLPSVMLLYRQARITAFCDNSYVAG